MLERYFPADLAGLIYKCLATEVSMSSNPSFRLECLLLSSRGDLVKVTHDVKEEYKTETIAYNVISADIVGCTLVFATKYFAVYKTLYAEAILYDSNVIKCLAGHGYVVAILNDGTIKVIGNNIVGQIGIEGAGDKLTEWTPVPNITDVIDGSCYTSETILVRSDGRIYIAGYDTTVLGDFELHPTVKDVVASFCSSSGIFFLTVSGNVLYSGDAGSTFRPFPINNVVQMSISNYHALFLTLDGKLFDYEIRRYHDTSKSAYHMIDLLSNNLKAKNILCGDSWSMVMDVTGKVYIIGKTVDSSSKEFIEITDVNLLR